MNVEGAGASRRVSRHVEALDAATRAYDAAVMRFATEDNHLELMRQSLREHSSVPLMLIASRPFGSTMELFPELVLNLCQGSSAGIYLAANIIRTLPKTDVEQRVVTELEALVDGMEADELGQLSDLLIELGIAAAVERVAAYAAARSDADMRRLAEDLQGVELDGTRWRLSRVERIRRREPEIR